MRREKADFDGEILKKAFRIGTPVAVQEVAMNSAMVMATRIIAPLGATAIAANSFAVTAESFCYMPGYGIGSAATTLVGKSVGARKPEIGETVRKYLYGHGSTFHGLYGPGDDVYLSGGLPDPDSGCNSAGTGHPGSSDRTSGGTSFSAFPSWRPEPYGGRGLRSSRSLMNLGSIWIVRLGLAVVLVRFLGLPGMWIAMAVELCVRGLLMLHRQRTSSYDAHSPKRTKTK